MCFHNSMFVKGNQSNLTKKSLQLHLQTIPYNKCYYIFKDKSEVVVKNINIVKELKKLAASLTE